MAHFWNTNKQKLVTEVAPQEPYFKKAYDFMMAWLNGTSEIELRTSGSTGAPKPIRITRNRFILSAEQTGEILQLGAGTKALVCLNIEYIAGMMMLIRGLELNWDLCIIEPDGNPFLSINQAVDFVAMVPMQLENCLENNATRAKLAAVKSVLLGGAPVSDSLILKLKGLPTRVFQSYGMTETVSHIALRQLHPVMQTNYQPVMGVQLGVDPRGCLHITGEVSNFERVQTNDLVVLEDNQHFRWLGRADNVINSGGVKIVLDVLDQKMASVFKEINWKYNFFSWYQEDALLGQKLILFIEQEEDHLKEKDIIFELSKGLTRYETPKHVYFVARFEKTPSQKIDKRNTAINYLNKI